MKRTSLLLAIVLTQVTACQSAPVPLTKALLKEYGISTAELTQLQYYVSDQINLKREQKTEKKGAEGDKVSGYTEITREHVFVLPDTPGVAEGGDFEQINVSFEQGSQFVFTWSKNENSPGQGRYRLTPKRELSTEERLAQTTALGLYAFDYRGNEYYSQQTNNVFLKVRLENLQTIIDKRHRMRGRTVGD